MSAIPSSYSDSWKNFNAALVKAKLSYNRGYSPEDVRRELHNLDSAYRKLHFICKREGTLPQELTSQAGSLFYYYGKTIYKHQPAAGRRIFLLSLSIQLNITQHYRPIKAIQECFLLEWLPLNLTRKSENQLIELCSKMIEHLPEAEYENIAPQKAYLWAKTMRFIIECCHKIKKFRTPTQINFSLLENISQTSNNILDKLVMSEKEIYWEKVYLMHLRYLSFKLFNPQDYKNGLQKLEQLAQLLNTEDCNLPLNLLANMMRAEIFFLKSKEIEIKMENSEQTEKLKLLKESILHCENAYITAHSFSNDAETRFKYLDKFLGLCLRSNETCHERKKDFLIYAPRIFNYISKSKPAADYAKYALTAANCFFYIGRIKRAKECLSITKKICLQFPKKTKEISNTISDLNHYIKNALSNFNPYIRN